MAVWMVRAGRHGEWEDLNLREGLSVIGYGVDLDLRTVHKREDVSPHVRRARPGLSDAQVRSIVGQLWTFRARIESGDMVVLPLKTRSAIAVGEVIGDYEHRTDITTLPDGPHHVRRIRWLNTEVPRSGVDRDILSALAPATVCRIDRKNVEARLRALAEGRALPQPSTDGTEDSADEGPDIAQAADDAIREHIGRKYQGHELERLIDAILKAQGYETWRSPVGADGGVDILAGRGPMGFDSPRLVVQVKAGVHVVDVKVLRELRGAMQSFNGEQGLLVSWGGFKDSTRREARQDFFKTRLWDDGDVVEALLDNYERLSPDIQKEIPLKRIWTLVQSDE